MRLHAKLKSAQVGPAWTGRNSGDYGLRVHASRSRADYAGTLSGTVKALTQSRQLKSGQEAYHAGEIIQELLQDCIDLRQASQDRTPVVLFVSESKGMPMFMCKGPRSSTPAHVGNLIMKPLALRGLGILSLRDSEPRSS